MELTKEQQDALKAINDWSHWVTNSIIDDDRERLLSNLGWMERAVADARRLVEVTA